MPVTGTITSSYDGLDRLVSEMTPQGSVSYAYDAAGRRTSMSVSGQTTVTYGFDNANRLTQITQGSANVSFGYDNDSRRTSLTLPNGVTLNYGYDAASQLTGITYMLGSNTLGNLTYAYDLAGRRTGVAGSYARTNTPQAAPAAMYNVNNQLTQWKGASLTYDANGNLTSDGTNTYTWNARNQLVSISGGASASFQYDPFGRRVSKTIGGMTQYLYDWANPVQEIAGTTASANLLTGGIDEYFQRTDSAGARNFLTDALGSTVALADSTGTLQTQYTFEPFGNTSVTGAATTNSFAYTGRELDATGLYFYRARYYSSQMQRFVSEDPIGFAGGINKYAYAGSSPTNYRDSQGTVYGIGQAGNEIQIIAPILIYGPGATYDLATKWSRAISSAWNGHTWRGCNVHVFAPIIDFPETSHWLLLPTRYGNNVFVNSDDPYYRGHVIHFGQYSYSFGNWGSESEDARVAHEFGHILGLPDQYKDIDGVSVSNPGFETDIMGASMEAVTDWDLERVLAGRACGCQ